MGFGQFMATSQFYLHGRKHCTQTGYERAAKRWADDDMLANPTPFMTGKVCMVTGANSGVGKEVARYLASKGATVHMVCRSRERGEVARREIVEATSNDSVHLMVCDCGLERSVRRAWDEFCGDGGAPPRLDVLVCNAGVLLNERTLTSEGVEATFACHLLFGTYLLATLAMPALEAASAGARAIVVSSGGMYNTNWPGKRPEPTKPSLRLNPKPNLPYLPNPYPPPLTCHPTPAHSPDLEWMVATSRAGGAYDGNLAYAYCKRGQVLLCERWAAAHPTVTFATCHPGWAKTDAVDAAYGDMKKCLALPFFDSKLEIPS